MSRRPKLDRLGLDLSLASSLPKILRRKRERNWGEVLASESEDGFNEIYREFRNPVFAYVLRKLQDREHAEDLTQEIFVKVHRFRTSYDAAQPFSAWFWTLVRNATYDWLRSKGSARAAADGDAILDELPTEDHDAETRVIRRCWRKGLLRRTRSLTRQQQKVLWLRFVHDLSYQEIARKLGLSLASVKCLVFRARASLKVELASHPTLA